MYINEDKKLIALVLAIILALSLLYVYSSNVKPEKVNIGGVARHIGDYVEVKGIVGYSKNITNGVLAYIYDEKFENKTTLFLQFSAILYPGEVVIAKGQVVNYRGSIEVVVYREGDLQIIAKYLELNLREVLEEPEHFLGMHIKLRGNLSAMRMSNYFEFTDGFNLIKVYVKNGYFGERNVYIRGYYEKGIFRAENISLQYNGTCVNLNELANYEGKVVWIHGSIISYFYYGYLRDGAYSLKVVADKKIPAGFRILEGKLIYSPYTAQYELKLE